MIDHSAERAESAHTHIAVATPAYGSQVTTAYVGGLLELQRRCIELNINLTIRIDGGDSLITRARNAMATDFINNPAYTHLMWIDADIGFTADTVLKLLHSDLPVVAGVYPLKKHFPVPDGVPPTDISSLNYVVGLCNEEYETREPGFMTVREVGTGFMMIKREVFTQLMEMFPSRKYVSDMTGSEGHPHWNFFDTEIHEGRLLSEDYAFCRLWRKAGGQIWVDLNSKLDHVGSFTFRGDWMATNEAMLEARKKADLSPKAPEETDAVEVEAT